MTIVYEMVTYLKKRLFGLTHSIFTYKFKIATDILPNQVLVLIVTVVPVQVFVVGVVAERLAITLPPPFHAHLGSVRNSFIKFGIPTVSYYPSNMVSSKRQIQTLCDLPEKFADKLTVKIVNKTLMIKKNLLFVINYQFNNNIIQF